MKRERLEELVGELLDRAGLTIENTTTASVARSVARSKP